MGDDGHVIESLLSEVAALEGAGWRLPDDVVMSEPEVAALVAPGVSVPDAVMRAPGGQPDEVVIVEVKRVQCASTFYKQAARRRRWRNLGTNFMFATTVCAGLEKVTPPLVEAIERAGYRVVGQALLLAVSEEASERACARIGRFAAAVHARTPTVLPAEIAVVRVPAAAFAA